MHSFAGKQQKHGNQGTHISGSRIRATFTCMHAYMHALHLSVAVHRLNISYHRLQHCTQSDTWKAVGSCWKAVGSCWKSVGVAWSPTGPQPKQHQHQWIGQHQCLAGAIPDCRIRTVHAVQCVYLVHFSLYSTVHIAVLAWVLPCFYLISKWRCDSWYMILPMPSRPQLKPAPRMNLIHSPHWKLHPCCEL